MSDVERGLGGAGVQVSDDAFAAIAFKQLFGSESGKVDEAVRAAVVEKATQ